MKSTVSKLSVTYFILAVIFAAVAVIAGIGMSGSANNSIAMVVIVLAAIGSLASIIIAIKAFTKLGKPMMLVTEQLKNMATGGDIEELDVNMFSGSLKTIAQYLNEARAALYLMLEDSGSLVEHATNGDLSARIDLTKHSGGYRQTLEGLNKTMDALTTPTIEVKNVLEEAFIKGNLNVSVKGDYKGDNAMIKNALNRFLSRLGFLIQDITTVLGEIGRGNIDVKLAEEYKGAFTAFNKNIETIIDSLNETMSGISTSAEQVASGTKQVSQGSQEISQGATEQASSIEELTASITEIAEQTKQNAMSAGKANELTLAAKNEAAHGNEQMKSMQQAMAEISESSRNINKIIKVIDDIAFQTNILALNAAVEAARAGVHGKGFAVVAEEVRNLAARSANAAKETTDLIEGSIRKTEAGTKIADDTAKALSGIVDGVDKAAQLVSEIAQASNEQAGAIAQVNSGIEQMSQVVQTNSATAEESAAASEELSSQAELLKEMVGKFRLRAQDQHKIAAAPEKRPAAVNAPEKAKPKEPVIKISDADFGKY